MNVQNTELYTHTSKVIIKIFMNLFDTLHKTEMQIQRTPLTRNVLNHVGKGKNIRKPIFFFLNYLFKHVMFFGGHLQTRPSVQQSFSESGSRSGLS